MTEAAARFGHIWDTVGQHRQNRLSRERTASPHSRRALDWMNFFVADVQEGFGAFIAFYLADLGWLQGSIGVVLTIGRAARALSLIPGGALVDAVRWKRAVIAVALAMIAASALILALHPTFLFVALAEILHGLTAGLITPALAAISLGLVGRRAMSSRIGRNYRFSGAGNALTAVGMGLLGSYLTNSIIFLVAAGLTVPAFVALSLVRKEEIDNDRARNAGKDKEGRSTLQGIPVLFKNRRLLWFACSVALFQLADGSMLPLAVEEIGRARATDSAAVTAAMIAVPQFVVAVLAPWVGYFSELWGRKPLLLASFAVEIVRAAVFMFASSADSLIAIQSLDGINGAIQTVLVTVIVTDLTTGTGRCNLARGGVGLIIAVAAGVSTAAFGFIAQEMAHWVAFLGMATVAAVGGLVVWLRLEETRPANYID